jgi:hypothetical protein
MLRTNSRTIWSSTYPCSSRLQQAFPFTHGYIQCGTWCCSIRAVAWKQSIASNSLPIKDTEPSWEELYINWDGVFGTSMAVKKLHGYLDGSTFTIITNHLALQWLLDFNGSNKRLIRWSMELRPYRPNMTICNRAERVHDNADPLSCAPLPTTNATEICNNTNSISHVEYPP